MKLVKTTQWTVTALGVLALSAAPCLGQPQARACTATAQNTFRSCLTEIVADFWLAQAECQNVADPEETQECQMEARGEIPGSIDECSDQHEARLEACEDLGEEPYDPEIDPADFQQPDGSPNPVDNPYFPLVPGTVFRYEGEEENVEVTVTEETREILGVTCVVVRDVVTSDGEVVEDTFDYYAQDADGNVWYFGETSKELEDGYLVSLEGSWIGGVDGAKPGIIMLADPMPGQTYRQEFALSVAEDLGRVLALDGMAEVPAGFFDNCLVTEDFTSLEPDALENKYYAPGVGQVLTVDVETGGRVELVEVIHP